MLVLKQLTHRERERERERMESENITQLTISLSCDEACCMNAGSTGDG